jgi:hypothetical protein
MHPGAGQALAGARNCGDHEWPVAVVESRRTSGQLTLVVAPETFGVPPPCVSASRPTALQFLDTSPPLPPGIKPRRI